MWEKPKPNVYQTVCLLFFLLFTALIQKGDIGMEAYFTMTGLLLPLCAWVYAMKTKPSREQWLIIAPAILFIFIGAVKYHAMGVFAYNWRSLEHGHELYFFGILITLGGFILLMLTCKPLPKEGEDSFRFRDWFSGLFVWDENAPFPEKNNDPKIQ